MKRVNQNKDRKKRPYVWIRVNFLEGKLLTVGRHLRSRDMEQLGLLYWCSEIPGFFASRFQLLWQQSEIKKERASYWDRPDKMLARVLGNLQMAEDTLMAFVNDEDPEVRLAVLENAYAPMEAYRILARDESADVRYAIAENHKCPMEVLNELADDENPYVSERSRRTIKRLAGQTEESTRDRQSFHLTAVESQPEDIGATNFAPEINRGAQTAAEQAMSEREKCTLELLQGLENLKEKRQEMMREDYAQNPLCFISKTLFLEGESISSWLVRVAENPMTPALILDQLATHVDPEVRVAVADNINCTIDSLWMLCKDESLDVRYALAENHNIAPEVLDFLSADDNPYVAHRARQTLRRLKNGQVIHGDFLGGGCTDLQTLAE